VWEGVDISVDLSLKVLFCYNRLSNHRHVTRQHLPQVTDFRNDVILAEACRQDVDKYCKDVEPGVTTTT
jgi:hypothetical protein